MAQITRLFLLIILTWMVVCGFIAAFEGDPQSIAAGLQRTSPGLRDLPETFVFLLAPFLRWEYFRYSLAPLGAILLSFFATARVVQHIYRLDRFGPALHYVLASMFDSIGWLSPRALIDGGRLELRRNRQNVLEVIGGPGALVLQPGNAVELRSLYRSRVLHLTGKEKLRPFERIGRTLTLDEQQGHVDELWAATRDNIRLYLRDIEYRFRLKPDTPRTVKDPHPFRVGVFMNMLRDLTVENHVVEPWQLSVHRSIKKAVREFIASRSIDELTAPRQAGANPRKELQLYLLAPGVNRILARLGASLIWINVGYFDIIDSDDHSRDVDPQRLAAWSVTWEGQGQNMAALAEATRIAYQELGRAEAQAELVTRLSEAMMANTPPEHGSPVQDVFLLNVASILDAMRVPKTRSEAGPEKSTEKKHATARPEEASGD